MNRKNICLPFLALILAGCDHEKTPMYEGGKLDPQKGAMTYSGYRYPVNDDDFIKTVVDDVASPTLIKKAEGCLKADAQPYEIYSKKMHCIGIDFLKTEGVVHLSNFVPTSNTNAKYASIELEYSKATDTFTVKFTRDRGVYELTPEDRKNFPEVAEYADLVNKPENQRTPADNEKIGDTPMGNHSIDDDRILTCTAAQFASNQTLASLLPIAHMMEENTKKIVFN